MLARLLSSLAGSVARRPYVVAGIFAVLAVGGAVAALRLEPSAGTDTFVGRGTDSYEASQRYHEKFGDDAVIVLVKGSLANLVLTKDLVKLVGLEGCIAGNIPKDFKEIPGGKDGPCAQLGKLKPARIVVGPGTFINEAVGRISDEVTNQLKTASDDMKKVSDAARKLALARGYSKKKADALASQAAQLRQAQFISEYGKLALQYGITSAPTLNDTQFVSKLVFGGAEPGTPKTRFAYLFPNKSSALVNVRLKPELSQDQRHKAIALIRQVVRMPEWKLDNGGAYVVTGAPVVLSDLTTSITDSIVLLLIAALLVMGATLALVFRIRLRLLPLAIAMGAAALTFGALSLAGSSLTMASIAVLPVLIGLAVDYAIQFQSRVQEADGDVRRAAALGGPTILTAGAATAAGFLVLVLSPVPMVRGFGLLLVAGIAIAFVATFTAGAAVLSIRGRARGGAGTPGDGAAGARGRGSARAAGIARGAARVGAVVARPFRAAGAALAPALRGAEELLTETRPVLAVRRRAALAGRATLRAATVRPGRVLAVALVLAAAGWALDTQTRVESDVQKLVPQDLPALQDLNALEQSTGVGGEIDLVVNSDELTDPETIAWMSRYQQGLLKRFGYSAKRGCGKAELCPAFSLPDLFASGGADTKAKIDGLLDAVPAYFSQGVITKDRKTATLAFGIRLMPLDEQARVIARMRADLKPPAGVTAELAGLPVLAAEANAKLTSPWRRALALVAGLLAVAFVLLVAFRDWSRALVPLIPIALATGWSALLLFATRIPLNPMSATLSALVVAISTEFSVLLSERYRQERLAGHAPESALARTYASTGRAVLASGATAIAGFAVLVVSDIRMLRDFGAVTVVDLTVSLLGVLVVLPAALLLAERGRLRIPRPALPKPPRLRRPGRSAA